MANVKRTGRIEKEPSSKPKSNLDAEGKIRTPNPCPNCGTPMFPKYKQVDSRIITIGFACWRCGDKK